MLFALEPAEEGDDEEPQWNHTAESNAKLFGAVSGHYGDSAHPARLARGYRKLLADSSLNGAQLSLSKSVQVIFGSHINLSVDQRRCGQDGSVKLVCSQYTQFFTSIQHHQHALFGCNIDLLVGSHGR